MAENIINKFLQLDNPDIARQTRNMSYGDAFKTENPFSKSYQGYRPGYTGADKVGLGGYVKQGINSLTGNFQQGSNVGGATPLTRKLAQDTMRFAPKALSTLASGPAQAAFFTLGSTPANADEANMGPEDFRALAEANSMTYGSSPITSSPINLDERYADQLAPGAYGKMGENVYTKMDDGSTRMDPYASQKFYDDGIFNDYFATNRYEDFNPRVGNMPTSTPQIGDAISRTNVQGMDYEMDPAAQEGFLNPNIQPSQNMFQRAGNAIQSGIGSIRDFAVDKGMSAKNLLGSGAAMAMGLPGIVGSGAMSLLSRFRGNPEQRARNEYNSQFSTGDTYGYGMGSASGANKDAFGYNTVSGFGNYEQHMIDKVEELEDLLTKTGRTGFKPGTPNFNMLRDYTKSINKIQQDNIVKKEEAAATAAAAFEAAMAQGQGFYDSLNDGAGASVSQESREQAGAGYDSVEQGSPFADGGLASMFVRRR